MEGVKEGRLCEAWGGRVTGAGGGGGGAGALAARGRAKPHCVRWAMAYYDREAEGGAAGARKGGRGWGRFDYKGKGTKTVFEEGGAMAV